MSATIMALALGAPAAAAGAAALTRRARRRRAADERGIALQTVIVMVVLLAIAGGVAAVLLTRGAEGIQEVEDQKIVQDAGRINNKYLCEAAGHTWTPANATKCG